MNAKKSISLFLVLCLAAGTAGAAEMIVHLPLDEGTGSTVYDYSGNSLTGAIYDTVNWLVDGGISGSALEFNPSGSDTTGHIEVVYNNPVGFDGISLTCWVKNYGQTTYGRLWHGYRGHYNFELESGDHPAFWFPGTGDLISSLTIPQDGQWHFLAMTIDDTTATTYVDDQVQAIATSSSRQWTDTEAWLGGVPEGGKEGWAGFVRPFHGCIDDWRLFNGTLTAEEVAAIKQGNPYQAHSPNPPHKATGIDPSLTQISWSNPEPRVPGDTITVDVYFGTDPTPTSKIVDKQPVESATVSLDADETYYWRVDCYDPNTPGPEVKTDGLIWRFSTPVVEAETNYYVATDGNDNNPGTLAEPFLTIGKARDRIRNSSLLPTGGVTIWIRGGNYYLDSTLTFTEQDSGEATKVITYRNYPGEEPNIIGGQKITGWTLDSGSIYKADVGSWTFDTLFENGTRCTKARQPDSGYMTMESKVSTLVFSYWDGDLSSFDFDDAEAFIWPGQNHWNWASETLEITNINPTNRQITLGSEPMGWGFERGNRYYLQGSKDFLNQAGEFYLDESAGYVYYWPVNTPIASQEIVAPKVKRIIEVKGSSEPGGVAEYIAFQGLNFTITDYSCDSWEGSDGLIHIECANNITVKFCRIENAGSNGVLLRKYCQNNEIYGNLISDIGNNGVSLYGWDPGTGPYSSAIESYTNKYNTISNNYIKNCGVLVGQGHGIYIKQSGDNEISYNRIRDIRHHGISINGNGWVTIPNPCYGIPVTWANHWDFVHSRNNNVKFNDVAWCYTDTQDVGIFYAFCPGKDNVVDNNLFHDSRATVSTRYAEGIYLDDEAGHFTIQNNIVYNVGFRRNPGSGILFKGEYNTVTNNIVVDNDNTDVDINIRFAAPGTVLTKNILYRENGKYLYSFWEWEDSNKPQESENNVFYHPGSNGRDIISGIPGNDTLTNWKSLFSNKYDQNSVTSDPLFVDRASHNYWLQGGSPALALGFVNIDQSSIGLKGDFPFSVDSDPAEATDDPVTTPMAHFEFNEGSGSRVSDESYGIEGYIDSPANWSSNGVLGTSAIEFNPNASDTLGQLHVATGFRFDGLTLTCWVRNYGQTNWGRLLQNAGGQAIAIDTSDRIGCYWFTDYTSTLTVPRDGELHFIAIAADSTTTTFYVDDLSQSVTTQGDPSFSVYGGLYLGGYVGDGWTRPFHGVIDDWRVFGTKLTNSQIETIRDEKADCYDLVSDLNGDYKVNVEDLVILAGSWLDGGTDLASFAALASEWLLCD